ncbi:MAG TPA: hypothetical protein VNI01_09115, partial [Elusimicrobiota bacterium]|nr:hypothetical protein [Elusimicrobiota bacterium]
YAHAANTAILAMHTAAGLGCPEDKRLALGLCALTVDLRRAAALARPLSQAEQEQLLHPLDPGKIFEHSLELEKVVPEELRSLYRADLGTEELAHAEKRREAHQGAHILAICDTYEAATHYRPWRAPILPRNAVLGLLGKHRRESDQKLVKTFTERISIYPPGSYVQLSNMDIGQVLRVQPFAPSSPVVEIRARADGSRQAPFYSVDLAKTQSSHVRQAVDETDDSIKDVALRVALQAERWWML